MSESFRSIVPLARDSLRGITPALSGALPTFEMVRPNDLFVEDGYQRDMGESSIALIRKIVGAFDWSRFKPPVCVRVKDMGNILVVIDGQHTATAAATHPEIASIPVMVVDVDRISDRAAAFVGHNRDRIALTKMAIHKADMLAGDAKAVAIDRACRAAGARILDKPINLKSRVPVGSTIAVGTIQNVLRDYGEDVLTRTLAILVKASRGPIKAHEVAAVADILGIMPEVDEKLCAVVARKSVDEWNAIATVEAVEKNDRINKALMTIWLRDMGVRAVAPNKLARRGAVNTQPAAPAPTTQQTDMKAAPVAAKPPAVKTAPQPATSAQSRANQDHVSVKQSAPIDKPQPETVKPSVPVVEFAGVRIDVGAGEVSRKRIVATTGEGGARLVAILAKVSPAVLEESAVAARLWKNPVSPGLRLRALAEEINPLLRPAGLEIRNVARTGWMLRIE